MKPTHAALIWADPNHVYLELPSPIPAARSHTVRVPNTVEGLAQALSILAARGPQSTIATSGAPTQLSLDAQVKAPLRKKPINPGPSISPEDREATEAVLRRLGVI